MKVIYLWNRDLQIGEPFGRIEGVGKYALLWNEKDSVKCVFTDGREVPLQTYSKEDIQAYLDDGTWVTREKW